MWELDVRIEVTVEQLIIHLEAWRVSLMTIRINRKNSKMRVDFLNPKYV
jgi:hypothetical protein